LRRSGASRRNSRGAPPRWQSDRLRRSDSETPMCLRTHYLPRISHGDGATDSTVLLCFRRVNCGAGRRFEATLPFPGTSCPTTGYRASRTRRRRTLRISLVPAWLIWAIAAAALAVGEILTPGLFSSDLLPSLQSLPASSRSPVLEQWFNYWR